MPRAVVVHQPDGEFPGWLLAWQRPQRPGRPWRALVRYRRPGALTFEHWVAQGEVRPAEPGQTPHLRSR